MKKTRARIALLVLASLAFTLTIRFGRGIFWSLPSDPTEVTEQQNATIDRDELTAAFNDPLLLDSFMLEKVTDAKSRVSGYRITEISETPFAKSFNLQVGDVITAVNDLNEVPNLDIAQNLYTRISASRPARLLLLRNHRPLMMNLTISE